MLRGYTGIIYMYKSPSEKYYIGQTTRPNFRKNEHLSRALKGSELPFHRAIIKYGMGTFTYKVLVTITCADLVVLNDTLNHLERYYISLYNSKVPYGYNVTDGGEGIAGAKFSQETKDKMSLSKLGHSCSQNTKEKMGKWQIGKRLSENTKAKISASHKGKICNSRVCCKYNLDGEFISEYSSIKEAAEMNNINKVSISLVLSGKHKTAGGYIWKYKEE